MTSDIVHINPLYPTHDLRRDMKQFLTLREEHRCRLFGTEVLRRILGSKKDELTGK
jgi:hypothetical protein